MQAWDICGTLARLTTGIILIAYKKNIVLNELCTEEETEKGLQNSDNHKRTLARMSYAPGDGSGRWEHHKLSFSAFL